MTIARKYFPAVLSLALLLIPSVALNAAYQNPIKIAGVTSIPCLLLALVDVVLLIGVPIIVMCIIYSGFLFVTGGDNEAKVQKARFVLTWTLVGALVLLSAKGIAMAVQATVLSLGATGGTGAAC